ncbi:MAG: diaminopimelate epimerase, partial [Oscillibacter sp.]
MQFWKMNGAGNDFLILNNLVEHLSPEEFPDLAKTLCERHLSIGADGLMVVDAPTMGGDYKMLFFNSDGSVGEMCGNGARCICRYGYEMGLAGETQTVETTAGVVTGKRIDRRLYKIRLNDPSIIRLDSPIEVDGVRYPCSYVELGNPGLPHAVVPYANLRRADEGELRELGRKMRSHPAFPKGANVNFYELVGEDLIYERTFERGVEDFTYACGTGTGSVVTVLTLQGKVSGQGVRVDMT